jgi:hypothetical protein
MRRLGNYEIRSRHSNHMCLVRTRHFTGRVVTQGRVTYITYFGSGGPRSGETIIGSQDAPGRDCGGQLFDFVVRVGYPTTDTSLSAYVRMHTILLRAYVHQRPIQFHYMCGQNLPELVRVQEINKVRAAVPVSNIPVPHANNPSPSHGGPSCAFFCRWRMQSHSTRPPSNWD